MLTRTATRIDPTLEGLVPHNRWDLLEALRLGEWHPRLRVTVVIPYYNARDALELTLRGLAAQSYPPNLLEVVVADDGSPVPLELPEGHLGLDVRVVRQPRQGFGAARARNLGARAATGDVLVFLDCDMIPEPVHVEAHARWHHVCDHAVTLGTRRHVDVGDTAPAGVEESARSGGLGSLFEGRPQRAPEWIEGHLRRTGELTSADHDLFRVVASGNLGVGAGLFQRCRGFDESFTQWGGEDTELGYRLFVAGGLLIPDRAALCWHQGDGHEPSPAEQASLEDQRAKLAHLVPHPGFRRARRGRSFLVPRLAVSVRAGDAARGEVLATVESVLASEVHDLVVEVELPDDHPDHLWLSRQFEHDERVVMDARLLHWAIPYRLELPAGALVEPEAVGAVLDRLSDPDDPIGVMNLTVPERRPAQARARAWSTRATGRVAASGVDDPGRRIDLAGELFGARWISGYDIGLRWSDAGTVLAVADAAPSRPSGSAQAELQELWQIVSRLDDNRRRQVIAAARAVFTQLSPRQLALLLRIAQRVLSRVAAIRALVRAR